MQVETPTSHSALDVMDDQSSDKRLRLRCRHANTQACGLCHAGREPSPTASIIDSQSVKREVAPLVWTAPRWF
jgi:hypothetical protein